MRIAVYTRSSFLYQKIKLAVSGTAEAVRVHSPREALGFELLLAEAEFAAADKDFSEASTQISDGAKDGLAQVADGAPNFSAIIADGGNEASQKEVDSANSASAKTAEISPNSSADSLKFGHVVGQSAFTRELYELGNGTRSLPRIVLMGEGCELPLPFTYGQLISVIEEKKDGSPALMIGEGCAYLRGERIALTEVEFALFEELYRKGGEFVSKEQLLGKVWGEGTDGGVVNVYVHYLRQKLERGERIILNSRMNGYKIDERFLKGGKDQCFE